MAKCSHLNIPIFIGYGPERRWLFLLRFLLSFRQYFVRETFISSECMSKKLGHKDEAEIGTGTRNLSTYRQFFWQRARFGDPSALWTVFLRICHLSLAPLVYRKGPLGDDMILANGGRSCRVRSPLQMNPSTDQSAHYISVAPKRQLRRGH